MPVKDDSGVLINKNFSFDEVSNLFENSQHSLVLVSEKRLEKIIDQKRKEVHIPSVKSKKLKIDGLASNANSDDLQGTLTENTSVLSSAVKNPSDSDNLSPIAFHELSLSRPLLRALTQMNFVQPTKIQAAIIPVALAGMDILGGATTGSGKTAAFIVPIIERLLYRARVIAAIRVLILLPTRELAVQCHEVACQLAQYTDIQVCLLAGGLPIKPQEQELKRRPDIIIATPGRLLDHLKNSLAFALDTVEILVLDEADRILEVGFKDELEEIIAACPKKRQTMFFSATLSDSMVDLAKLSLDKPVRIMVDSCESIALNLSQEFVRIRDDKEREREAILLAICKHYYTERCIVFFQTKVEAHRMLILFRLHDLKAAELHGNLNQVERLEALSRFKNGNVQFLLATDVAARGLDIPAIQTVINSSIPPTYTQYLHRIGRTARAGMSGRSISLAAESDRKILKLAIKNSRDTVKQRSIKPEFISMYALSIVDMEPQLLEIMMEEKQAKELDTANMELRKAENMIRHADQIYARPKKSWIAGSNKSRKNAKFGKRKPAKSSEGKSKRKTE